MLLQLPFLLAIFYATKSDKFVAIITKDGVFPGFSEAWLPNLAQPDALYILPILIGLLTYLGQKFTPSSSANKQQQQIMLILPFFLIAICLKMPAGVPNLLGSIAIIFNGSTSNSNERNKRS